MAIGQVYIQEEDPGAVGFGNEWLVRSTGLRFVRNSSNTAWVSYGSAALPNGGFLPYNTTGGVTIYGAMTGPTGWAPISSPDFATSLTVNNVSVATVNDLTSMQSQIMSGIDGRISEQVMIFSKSITINSSFAFKQGVTDNAWYNSVIVLPTPVFTSDDTTASPTNSTISIMLTPVWGTGTVLYRNETDTDDVNPYVLGNSFIAYYLNYDAVKQPAKLRYMIVAQR